MKKFLVSFLIGFISLGLFMVGAAFLKLPKSSQYKANILIAQTTSGSTGQVTTSPNLSATPIICSRVLAASSTNAAGNGTSDNDGISFFTRVTTDQNNGYGTEIAFINRQNQLSIRQQGLVPANLFVGTYTRVAEQTLTVTCDEGTYTVYVPALAEANTNWRFLVTKDGSTYHCRGNHDYSQWLGYPNSCDLTSTQMIVPEHVARKAPGWQADCSYYNATTYGNWECDGEGKSYRRHLKTISGKNYDQASNSCTVPYTTSNFESEACASGQICSAGACVAPNYGATLSVSPASSSISLITNTSATTVTIPAKLTITNLAAIPDSFTLDIPDNNPGCVFTQSQVSLNSGEQKVMDLNCSIPVTQAPGTYNMLLRTKSAGLSAQTGMHPYNSVSFSITLTGQTSTTSTTNSVSSDSSLIGYWKFDGNGRNSVPGGLPDVVAVGNASFKSTGGKADGYGYIPSGSDYFKIPYDPRSDLQTWTIEFWLRQRSNQSFFQDLVFKGSQINDYNFRIFRQLWNQYNFGPIITGYTSSTTGYWTQTSNPNQLSHGEWHQVVYTKSPTEAVYYLDGVLIHSLSNPPPAKMPATDIFIGKPAIDTDIDILRIYNRALSESEVRQNGGFPPLAPPPPYTPPPYIPPAPVVYSGSTGTTTGTAALGSGTTGLTVNTLPPQNSGATGLNSGPTGNQTNNSPAPRYDLNPNLNTGASTINNPAYPDSRGSPSLLDQITSGNQALTPNSSQKTINDDTQNITENNLSGLNEAIDKFEKLFSEKNIQKRSLLFKLDLFKNTVDQAEQAFNFNDYNKVSRLVIRAGVQENELTGLIANENSLKTKTLNEKTTDSPPVTSENIHDLINQTVDKEVATQVNDLIQKMSGKIDVVGMLMDESLRNVTEKIAGLQQNVGQIEGSIAKISETMMSALANLSFVPEDKKTAILAAKNTLIEQNKTITALLPESVSNRATSQSIQNIVDQAAIMNWCGQNISAIQDIIKNDLATPLSNKKTFTVSEIKSLEKSLTTLIENNPQECFAVGVSHFNDTKTEDWYFESTEYNQKEGLMLGYFDKNNRPTGKFCPGCETLGIEALAMEMRLFAIPVDATAQKTIPGVPAWGVPYILAAASNGIKLDDLNIAWDKPVDRLEAAKLITRVGQNFIELPASIAISPTHYQDYANFKNDPEGAKAVEALTELSIFQGDQIGDQTKFNPENTFNRAAMAAVNQRIMENLNLK